MSPRILSSRPAEVLPHHIPQMSSGSSGAGSSATSPWCSFERLRYLLIRRRVRLSSHSYIPTHPFIPLLPPKQPGRRSHDPPTHLYTDSKQVHVRQYEGSYERRGGGALQVSLAHRRRCTCDTDRAKCHCQGRINRWSHRHCGRCRRCPSREQKIPLLPSAHRPIPSFPCRLDRNIRRYVFTIYIFTD
jgi:hypothetical protein